MDSFDFQSLKKRFIKMVDQPKLASEFPEQFSKHWENKGRSGIVQIIQARLIDQPCELKFSLFFDGDEVIQTGIVIKYQGEVVINEVRKGDDLDFKTHKRIDPVAFLKERYATVASDGLPAEFSSDSYTLAIDEDSEPEVFRAVSQLTGRTEAELTDRWRDLIASNHKRAGKDQVSIIIKSWLKKERDRLDLLYLQDARILHPRTDEVTHFAAHERVYTVVAKTLTSAAIVEKVDSPQPEWWGGAFYAYVNTLFCRVPHEQKDQLLFLKAFDSSIEFAVEEIFVDNRHIYSVVYAGEEAIVFRTRNQVSATSQGIFQPHPTAAEPGKMGKLMARLTGKPVAQSTAAVLELEEESTLAQTHPYHVLRAAKAYLHALRHKSADLNDLRKEYFTLFYDSDPQRFANRPEELLAEIEIPVTRELRKNAPYLAREKSLLQAYITIFYAERNPL